MGLKSRQEFDLVMHRNFQRSESKHLECGISATFRDLHQNSHRMAFNHVFSFANSRILHTVLQLRSVIGTPSSFSEFAASLDLPIPAGA